MYFPSKRDKWISLIVWGIVLLGVGVPLIKGQVITLFVMLVVGVFLLWFWFRTGYLIEDHHIKVRYGPIKQTVHIQDIQQVVKSKLPFSSPALSLERIQINCASKYDQVTISPENQQVFIEKLLEINPDIAIDNRLVRK
ncbi:PH domain-containing protein [Oceanobacillus bengalensis]|uniref:Uncharacterized protein YyaB-like PH domain-containing protein n=1 Tax=Oceanobacillus bengalensis TaxID=1435466 RepID=A0A494YSQ9_9BACI|nr:PH domain-containing protein [Oceanobacillus bengalensis]RKQ13141.1 hypothetical protein D8M05_17170 [Oceanobacillus bengalensis]